LRTLTVMFEKRSGVKKRKKQGVNGGEEAPLLGFGPATTTAMRDLRTKDLLGKRKKEIGHGKEWSSPP